MTYDPEMLDASDVRAEARTSRELSGESSKAARAPKASSETAKLHEFDFGNVAPSVRKVMKANKRSDTKPELLVRQRLWGAGLRGYRLHWKVAGHPDIAWPGKKVALFVNGCFWHRCPHCKPSMPKSNVEYWVVKFDMNQQRDVRKIRELEEAGWKVHIIWECQLKKKMIDQTFEELLPVLAKELGKPLAV